MPEPGSSARASTIPKNLTAPAESSRDRPKREHSRSGTRKGDERVAVSSPTRAHYPRKAHPNWLNHPGVGGFDPRTEPVTLPRRPARVVRILEVSQGYQRPNPHVSDSQSALLERDALRRLGYPSEVPSPITHEQKMRFAWFRALPDFASRILCL